MNKDTDDKSRIKKSQKFITILGYVFVLMFIGCLYTIYVSLTYFPAHHVYFETVIGIWYLLTGIGLLTRKKIGYYSLKLFLYVFLIGFPIGTIISYKILKYIKKHNLKNLF